MGFNPTTNVVLNYNQTEFKDAQVTVSLGLSMAKYLEAQRWIREEMSTDDPKFCELFVQEGLVSWNVEDDDGNPVPTTLEGFMSLPFRFVLATVNTWFLAIGRVSDPLEPTLNGGDMSGEASIPRDELLPDLSSLSRPN